MNLLNCSTVLNIFSGQRYCLQKRLSCCLTICGPLKSGVCMCTTCVLLSDILDSVLNMQSFLRQNIQAAINHPSRSGDKSARLYL